MVDNPQVDETTIHPIVPSQPYAYVCREVEPVVVSEGVAVGTAVGRILATDPDEGSRLEYRLDYNRSQARREDGALVSLADWQAGGRYRTVQPLVLGLTYSLFGSSFF